MPGGAACRYSRSFRLFSAEATVVHTAHDGQINAGSIYLFRETVQLQSHTLGTKLHHLKEHLRRGIILIVSVKGRGVILH